MLLKLEGLTFALSIEVVKDLMFARIFDDYMQMVKNENISSLLFELEGFTLTQTIDVLEGFIFAILVEATGKEGKGSKT